MAIQPAGYVRFSRGFVQFGDLYVALFTSPTEEVSAPWYSLRPQAEFSESSGVISNDSVISYGNASTSGVVITHGALFSSQTGGEPLDVSPVSMAVSPTETGSPVSIPASGYVITPMP